MRRGVVWTISGAVVAGVMARRSLVVIRVDGASMVPTYADGDRLLAVRPWLVERLRPGDVVVVRAPAPAWTAEQTLDHAEVVVVKRVQSLDAGAVVVRGDADESYDSATFGPLPRSAVVARVVGRLPATSPLRDRRW